MKVWITKHCLTQGIMEINANETNFKDMIALDEKGAGLISYYHTEGKEWHKSKESAQERAEEIRKRKIESFKRQIKKLEALRFE